MSNKASPRSAYMKRRTPQSQLFDFSLTKTYNRTRTPLNYSQSPDMTKLIDINHVPTRNQVFPETTDFEGQAFQAQITCHRKDCLDRKFRAIKYTQKSSPNVKIVSPKKVDIVLGNENEPFGIAKHPGIHSFKKLSPRPSTEKDMLKQFRELEEARKDLKSRKQQLNRPISLGVNMVKSANFSPAHKQYNPEKSHLYMDVKNKISRRYNSMFRKYADSYQEEYKNKQQFLKELCRATKITSRMGNRHS